MIDTAIAATASPETHPASRAARIRRQAQDRSRRWRARKAADALRMADVAAEAEGLIERALIDGAVLTALVKLHMQRRSVTGAEVAIPFVEIVRETKAILVEAGKSYDWASGNVRDRLRREAQTVAATGFPGPVAATMPVSLQAAAE